MLRPGGVVAAEGTPEELKSAIGGDWLDVSVADPADLPRLQRAGRAVRRRRAADRRSGRADQHSGGRPDPGTGRRCRPRSTEAGFEPLDIAVRRPTLDEVFLHLTGHRPPARGRQAAAPSIRDDGGPCVHGSALGDAWLITRRQFWHWRAQPGVLLVGLLFPVLVTLMFGALFGGAIAGPPDAATTTPS